MRSTVAVRGVGREELPHPLAQHGQPGLVARDDGEVARHALHVVQRVPQQRLEQVFLVREVQVERAVRDPRPAHHVVDADPVEAALLELDRARLEQLAHGLPALRAQLAVLGGRAAAERRPPLRFAYRPPGRPPWPGARLGGTPVCLLRHSQSVALASALPRAYRQMRHMRAPIAWRTGSWWHGRGPIQLGNCEAAEHPSYVAAGHRGRCAGSGRRGRGWLGRRGQSRACRLAHRRRVRRERPAPGRARPHRRRPRQRHRGRSRQAQEAEPGPGRAARRRRADHGQRRAADRARRDGERAASLDPAGHGGQRQRCGAASPPAT